MKRGSTVAEYTGHTLGIQYTHVYERHLLTVYNM